MSTPLASHEPPANLVDCKLDYESIINNPILQPIAEANKSYLDLENIKFKVLVDIDRNKKWIDEVVKECSIYNDSEYCSRLYHAFQQASDVIHYQEMEIKTFIKTIRDIVQEVKNNYGVKVQRSLQKKDLVVPTTPETKSAPEIDYFHYLTKLQSNKDELIRDVSTRIIDLLQKDKSKKSERNKFEIACYTIFEKEEQKEIKDLIKKIVDIDIQGVTL